MTVGNTRHERGCPTCARVHCASLMKQLGNPTCSAGLGRPRHLLFALKYAGINPAGLKSLMCVCHFYLCFFFFHNSGAGITFFPPRQSGPNYSGLEERLSLQGNIKGLQTPPPPDTTPQASRGSVFQGASIANCWVGTCLQSCRSGRLISSVAAEIC